MESPHHKRRRTEEDNGAGRSSNSANNNGNNGNGHRHDSHHNNGHASSSVSTVEQPPPHPFAGYELEILITFLPDAHLRSLVLRHAQTCDAFASDIRHALLTHQHTQPNNPDDEAASSSWPPQHEHGHAAADDDAQLFLDLGDQIRDMLGDVARRHAVGSRDYVYDEIRRFVAYVGRQARPPGAASFGARRSGLVALRRIGKAVCLSGEGAAGGLIEMFQEGETLFVDTVEEIVEGLSEEEKAEVRGWVERDGGEEEEGSEAETFEDKMFELVGLAEERNVFDGLSVAAEKLGLVFDYGDSDENGHEQEQEEQDSRLGEEDEEEEEGVDFSVEEQNVRRILDAYSTSPGTVYLRVRGLIYRISGAVRQDASYGTRRNALITLRRIADIFVTRPTDDTQRRRIQEQFRDDRDMSKVFMQLIGGLTQLERKKLSDTRDGDKTFGERFREMATLAKASRLMTGLDCCADLLRMHPASRVKDNEICGGGGCPTCGSPVVAGTYTPRPPLYRRETIGFSKAFQGVLSALNINWHSIRKSDYEQITAATNVYNRLIDLTNEVDGAANPSAPLSTRRHALVKLLKIASMILRTVDRKPSAAYPIKGRFLNDDILGPTCKMIADQMTNNEKQSVLRMKNGKGLTFEAELVKIVKLAIRHNILLGMRNCLTQLRWQVR